MWGTFLSEPLRIVALVGRYPTNWLMRRMPILRRCRHLSPAGDASGREYAGLVGISPGYTPPQGRLHTCYSPVRRSPAEQASLLPAAPRLACVKPVASVHPEPGSNSSLLLILFSFFQNLNKQVFFLIYCLFTRRLDPAGTLLSYQELTRDFRATSPLSRRSANALVLLLVYCNRFNVLFFNCSGRLPPESECKVTAIL